MRSSRLLVEVHYNVGVIAKEHLLCQIVASIHPLSATQLLAVAVLGGESEIHLLGVVESELLNCRASAGTGVPSLVEVLKEWEPRSGVVVSAAGC